MAKEKYVDIYIAITNERGLKYSDAIGKD